MISLYWVGMGERLKVFNADDTLVFDLALPFTIPLSIFGHSQGMRVLWKPDSSGFFIAVEEEIYHVDIASKGIQLVEDAALAPDENMAFTIVGEK